MEPETGCEICFGIAYWEKRWVAVPFFHVPEDAINESGDLMRFKVTPLEGHIIESPPRRENRALETMVVSESIVPRLWSEKALKQLCKRNDLPLAWVTDGFPRKKCRTSGDANRREDRKIKSLTPKEFRSIRRELDKLNKQAALIINILWFLNQSLGKGGGFVTLAEVVRLKADDISPENNDGSNWIQLIRTRGDRTHMVVHCLPPRLWKSLCSQIDETSPFVFSSRDEGPFLPGQIDSYLKRAAEKAGIKGTITKCFA